MRCGECGGSITLVSGRRKNGAEAYGCSFHQQRGDSVCTNGLLIRREDLEQRLLEGLQETVLSEEVIDYAVKRIAEELERQHDELNSELAQLRDESRRHETEIARLVEAIATGRGGSSLTEAIAEREKKIRQIADRLVGVGSGSMQDKLGELREFAISRLSNLRKLLSTPASVHEARALLAEQVGKFTLSRDATTEKASYKATGSVDLFGEKLVRVDGAGGQNRTGYARLFRAALYQ